MKADVLVAEIGSTTTVVNAFSGMGTQYPRFLGQGGAPTTVAEGDVTEGLRTALDALRKNLGTETLEWGRFFASSSAAGGLRMTVHGLVYDMTVRAAREAALGAGANLHQVTAGVMRPRDLERLKEIGPNIILLAGGVDFGERDTVLKNAEQIAAMDLGIPVIYGGNRENRDEIRAIFARTRSPLVLVENVYPAIDRLEVGPARKAIQEVFEEHIVHAPGMETIRTMVDGPVVPTPGAVMEATRLLKAYLGDLITFDVGGATTDVHSVTLGSDEVGRIQLSPEPEAKRTVEGDLGIYLNRFNVQNAVEKTELSRLCGCPEEELAEAVQNLPPLPRTPREKALARALARTALDAGLERHVGRYRESFTPSGKKTLAEGRDLTAIKWAVGTGGALSRLPGGRKLLEELFARNRKNALLPAAPPKILIDKGYIMASLGVLGREYPREAAALFFDWAEMPEGERHGGA